MGSGWGTHVNPWLIHVNVWQKPLQYCKIISLQLIKINEKKKKKKEMQQHGCTNYGFGIDYLGTFCLSFAKISISQRESKY